ncbi:MAG TPA: ATP-binding protein [Longimicrobiales bacterium]
MRVNNTDRIDRHDFPDAFDPAGVALGIIDADGVLKLANHGWGGDGRDRHAPKAMQVRPGANCSQALRESAQRGDESAKRVLQAFDWILSGVVRSIRCEYFEPTPELRWFDITISRLRDGAGIVVTSIDLTARKHALATAAELNSPLRAISDRATAALSKLGEQSETKQSALNETVAAISRAAALAGLLVHRMRILLSGVAAPRTDLDVNELVREVLELVSSVARRNEVCIAAALDPRRPLVFGDAAQLQELLINLLLNGIDATVSANPDPRNLHVTTTRTASTVEICIKNHCPQTSAAGHALPVARAIAESHGGSVRARNLGDHGTSIQVTLPSASRTSYAYRPKSNRIRLGPALG